MKVRLLKKEEIDKAKQADKAREIQEGLKLSKKVDGLRELWAAEEEKIGLWRTETLSEIMKEVKNLTFERDNLIVEIGTLEKEKDKILNG